MGNRKKSRREKLPNSEAGEDDTLENASVMSVVSEGGHSSVMGSGEEGEDSPESNPKIAAEDAFSDALDALTASSSAAREKALIALKNMLQMKCLSLFNVIAKNYETLSDALTNCVKRGKNAECMLAGHCLSLLCMHLVNFADCDVEKFYLSHLKPILRQILTDESFPPNDRSAIAASLGLACYSCSDDPKDVENVMTILESVYVGSALKGDGTVRNVSPQHAHLHQSALMSWAVLFSRDCCFIPDSTLVKMTELLQSPDVDVRISAGETLALIYEMRRQSVPNYRIINHRDLCDRLNSMAHEGQKSKAKKDLKLQRSSFRDIAHYIDGSSREVEVDSIKIDKSDLLELSSWSDKLIYHVLCGVFGSGLKIQLQENSYIRERVFGMDPWVPPTAESHVDDKSMKNELKRVRKIEEHARKMERQKGRGKRLASFASFSGQ